MKLGIRNLELLWQDFGELSRVAGSTRLTTGQDRSELGNDEWRVANSEFRIIQELAPEVSSEIRAT